MDHKTRPATEFSAILFSLSLTFFNAFPPWIWPNKALKPPPGAELGGTGADVGGVGGASEGGAGGAGGLPKDDGASGGGATGGGGGGGGGGPAAEGALMLNELGVGSYDIGAILISSAGASSGDGVANSSLESVDENSSPFTPNTPPPESGVLGATGGTSGARGGA